MSANVRPHSIHALMGENGARANQRIKMSFGIYQKTPAACISGKEIGLPFGESAGGEWDFDGTRELNLVLQRSVMDNMVGTLSRKRYVCRRDKMYGIPKRYLMNWISILTRARA